MSRIRLPHTKLSLSTNFIFCRKFLVLAASLLLARGSHAYTTTPSIWGSSAGGGNYLPFEPYHYVGEPVEPTTKAPTTKPPPVYEIAEQPQLIQELTRQQDVQPDAPVVQQTVQETQQTVQESVSSVQKSVKALRRNAGSKDFVSRLQALLRQTADIASDPSANVTDITKEIVSVLINNKRKRTPAPLPPTTKRPPTTTQETTTSTKKPLLEMTLAELLLAAARGKSSVTEGETSVSVEGLVGRWGQIINSRIICQLDRDT